MPNPYRKEWKTKPPGYYADPAVKSRHDRRRREMRAMAKATERELEKMPTSEPPTQEEVEEAQRRARQKL